ncbi:MAG: YwaF family protein [Bacilli bacterium]|nr:YwaF family protein [Bacilli bacterium]
MEFFSNDGIGNIPGLMGWAHFIYILISVILVMGLLLMTHHFSHEKIAKMIKTIFWVILILEILKIIWNLAIRIGTTLSDWIPLYYCSIFIYGLGLASYGKKTLKRLGEAWIFYGQIVAGIAFIFYPSTALLIHPFLHVLTFHSLIYHSLAIFVGLVMIITGYFQPKKEDFKHYSISLLLICLGAYLLNRIIDTNLMFLNEPLLVWPLMNIYNLSNILYPIIIALAQVCGAYAVTYCFYHIISKIVRNSKEKAM